MMKTIKISFGQGIPLEIREVQDAMWIEKFGSLWLANKYYDTECLDGQRSRGGCRTWSQVCRRSSMAALPA